MSTFNIFAFDVMRNISDLLAKMSLCDSSHVTVYSQSPLQSYIMRKTQIIELISKSFYLNKQKNFLLIKPQF